MKRNTKIVQMQNGRLKLKIRGILRKLGANQTQTLINGKNPNKFIIVFILCFLAPNIAFGAESEL